MNLQLVFCHRPNPFAEASCPHRERIYAAWKRVYAYEFQRQGKEAAFFSDSFLRYDTAMALLDAEAVVGSSSFSFFDFGLASTLDHSYTRNLLTERSLSALAERNIKRILTFESFFITPDYRKDKARLAVLITRLGLRYYHTLRAQLALDAALTVARTSKHMHEVAAHSGFELVRDDLFYNGESAALLIYTRQEESPPESRECREQIARLWAERI